MNKEQDAPNSEKTKPVLILLSDMLGNYSLETYDSVIIMKIYYVCVGTP